MGEEAWSLRGTQGEGPSLSARSQASRPTRWQPLPQPMPASPGHWSPAQFLGHSQEAQVSTDTGLPLGLRGFLGRYG